MRIIQLVPSLPPNVDGIGDYSLQLARRLRDEQGIYTSFVVCDLHWKGSSLVEGFAAAGLTERTPQGLRGALCSLQPSNESTLLPLLVQFAVYGYEKRGCPFWLAKVLEEIGKENSRSIHLALHELENRAWKPWSSVFWVRGIQKWLIRRIAATGRFRYTNTEEYRLRLERWGITGVCLIPNFSTLGEPAVNPPFSERRMDMVVFGRAAQRAWTYEYGRDILGPLCAHLGVERIIDIGQPMEGTQQDRYGETPVLRCGRLPAAEVNSWMAQSAVSFIYYPIPVLTKSSVYAASAAHGSVPFVLDKDAARHSCPPLIEGESYVSVTGTSFNNVSNSLRDLSQRVFEDYQRHSSTMAAAVVARGLRGDR